MAADDANISDLTARNANKKRVVEPLTPRESAVRALRAREAGETAFSPPACGVGAAHINKKVYGLLGLAAKKGSVVSGGNACERALKNGASGLMIIAGDASGNTKDRFVRMAGAGGASGKAGGDEPGRKFRGNVDYVIFGDCLELGRRIGRGERSVVIVTDLGLSHGIHELLLPSDIITGV